MREVDTETLHDVELIWATAALLILKENILHTLESEEGILNLIFL